MHLQSVTSLRQNDFVISNSVESKPIRKLYYSITEVARMIGEEQHVLRYWERMFPALHPGKNRAGNRIYTVKDLAVLTIIKRLLRIDRRTIAAARDYLSQHGIAHEIAQEEEALNTAIGKSMETPFSNPTEGMATNGNLVVNEVREAENDLEKNERLHAAALELKEMARILRSFLKP